MMALMAQRLMLARCICSHLAAVISPVARYLMSLAKAIAVMMPLMSAPLRPVTDLGPLLRLMIMVTGLLLAHLVMMAAAIVRQILVQSIYLALAIRTLATYHWKPQSVIPTVTLMQI